MVDVIEYAFTEWLVRQGISAAFKDNFDISLPLHGGFRERLRVHIRRCLRLSELTPACLISSAFVFAFTSEGTAFWVKHSDAWRRFCAGLRANF